MIKCEKCGKVRRGKLYWDGLPPLHPSDTFLRYHCKKCSDNREECLERLYVSWVDVVYLILYEMITNNEKVCDNVIEGVKFFHWRSICEEISLYWPLLWLRDAGGRWHSSVVAALATYSNARFRNGKEIKAALNGFWSLLDIVPPSDMELADHFRRPEYRINIENGQLTPIEHPRQCRKSDVNEIEGVRRLKREMHQMAASYIFSNIDFDRPNPVNTPVVISQLTTHSAPQINTIDKSTDPTATKIINEKGYAMARASHGVDQPGTWYYEVTFLEGGGHLRVGWAQILAQCQASVGFDEFSYGIRDTDGAKMHCGRLSPYGNLAITPGSTIGCILELPLHYADDPPKFSESGREEMERQYPPLKLGKYQIKQDILADSSISFSVNGTILGKAFAPLYHAKYYPAISLFGGARAQVNFGPIFHHQPQLLNCRPISELGLS